MDYFFRQETSSYSTDPDRAGYARRALHSAPIGLVLRRAVLENPQYS
jgi:hypothetical protein